MVTKYQNTSAPGETIQMRPGLVVPDDYHCTCGYCSKFMGEIYCNTTDKYYSNKIRKGYYVNQAGDHLDVGHVVGYRWAVQNLCPPGGWVFDPTVGSGTAIVEAITNGRNGVGIELEYPEVAVRNIEAQTLAWTGNQSILIPGNALFTEELLTDALIAKESFDLIVNGPPYPSPGALSSDAPERLMGVKGKKTPNYMHPENFGLARQGRDWEGLIISMYTQSCEFLKPGGHIVILIKDMMRNRKPALLHKETVDLILQNVPGMEYKGFYLHKHVPTTMFMNTYPKRFPGIAVPMYQVGVVLQKL